MSKRKRDDLWKCLFYFSNIVVSKGFGVHLGCQKERKTEWDAELDAKSVLSSFRDHFGSHFGSQHRQNSDVDLQHGFRAFCGQAVEARITFELAGR